MVFDRTGDGVGRSEQFDLEDALLRDCFRPERVVAAWHERQVELAVDSDDAAAVHIRGERFSGSHPARDTHELQLFGPLSFLADGPGEVVPCGMRFVDEVEDSAPTEDDLHAVAFNRSSYECLADL